MKAKTSQENLNKINRQANPADTYSVLGMLAMFILYWMLNWTLGRCLWLWIGRGAASYLGYFPPLLALILVLVIVRYQHPSIFKLSSWKLSFLDLSVAVISGLGVQAVIFTLVVFLHWPVSPSAIYPYQTDPWSGIVAIVILYPILEELFFRGVFLRSSLKIRSVFDSLVLVSMIIAFFHDNFFIAFPQQLMLATVYHYRKRSLPASIAAHVCMNGYLYIRAAHLIKLP